MARVPVVRIDRSLRRSLRAFDADRLHFLDEAAVLGPVAGLRFGPSTVYVVSDADVARTIRDQPADLISLKLGINIVNGDTMRDVPVPPRVRVTSFGVVAEASVT